MGVLNVTPDSFADGGRYLGLRQAVDRGLQMAGEGADVIDVGGESTRPGATPVDEAEELRRVLPVVEALADALGDGGPRLSVDTAKPAVARAAVAAGATLINDVSASLWPVAAETGAGWAAMHMQGTPATMQRNPRYQDVVAEVAEFLAVRAARAVGAGVGEVWIDPGIGFGKTAAHNLSLLAHLDRLVATAQEAGAAGVLVGASRKSTMGVLGRPEGSPPLPVAERLPASLATAVWAMGQGVTMVRVHDVAPTVQAARLVGRPSAAGAGVAPVARARRGGGAAVDDGSGEAA